MPNDSVTAKHSQVKLKRARVKLTCSTRRHHTFGVITARDTANARVWWQANCSALPVTKLYS